MNLERAWTAALGHGARVGESTWRVADAGAACRTVELAVAARAPLSPGCAREGRQALLAPAGIHTLWAEELVARIGAGTSLEDAENALAAHGLSLGIEGADPARTTLGATFAAGRHGMAGPRGYRLRDRTTGVGFVDGRARLIAGGSRVVKNVAGYDFGRLHHGAQGSLGLVLDLTLRLIRAPEERAAVWWPCTREELPVRLPALRREWGQDAVAEALVEAAAARRVGLPGPGLVFRQFGDSDLIAERIARTGARRVDAAWPALLTITAAPARQLTPTDLVERDPGEGWVADPGSGRLWLMDSATPVPEVQHGAAAVKRVFDPHGIWPPLPGVAP